MKQSIAALHRRLDTLDPGAMPPVVMFMVYADESESEALDRHFRENPDLRDQWDAWQRRLTTRPPANWPKSVPFAASVVSVHMPPDNGNVVHIGNHGTKTRPHTERPGAGAPRPDSHSTQRLPRRGDSPLHATTD